MSGGYWDYVQYRVLNVADDIKYDLCDEYCKDCDDDVKQLIKSLGRDIRRVGEIIGAIDYLVCGDYGCDTFAKRIAEINEMKHED